jgi:hypothetical protein
VTRPPLLVPALAIAALLAGPTTMAPAASPEGGPIVTVELELPASDGLEAHLETSEKEMVTLEIGDGDGDRSVTYEVKGEVSAAGLKVRFGRLGHIDVGFTPTRTLNSTEPSEGCTGEPRTLREGVFSGTIDFRGERDYVRISASEAAGSMSVISQWECPEEPTPFATVSRLLAGNPAREGRSASLHAGKLRCNCDFSAGTHRRSNGPWRSIFYGARAELREGMEILRLTVAHGGGSAFVFDHEAGTATVRPPRPFTGRAVFRRRPDAPDLWRSTIRVPLLGALPLKTDGPGFEAGLYPEYHFD